jgi:hypothetical protein
MTAAGPSRASEGSARDPGTPGPPEEGRVRPPTRYEFLLPGRVSAAVVTAFPELSVASSATGGTVMFGPVEDNAHLHGLLDRFQTFGLTVLELRQLPD